MNKLFIKYIIGSITKEELEELKRNSEKPKAKAHLKINYRIYFLINVLFVKTDIDKAYQNTTKKIIFRENRKQNLVYSIFKYASIFLFIAGLTWFFKDEIFSADNNQALLIPKKENITLELNNGKLLTLNTSEIKTISNADGRKISYQNANRLDYTSFSQDDDKSFNTLRVPNGKKFVLLLSDSTVVHLNSGSSITYPVSFKGQNNRNVTLTGEAYLDVYPNTNKPFTVHTFNSAIKVLGTRFNVNSFQEDDMTEIVLVEGSVSFQQQHSADNAVILKPNQKATLNNNSPDIEISTVKTSLYTSWMDDKLVFRNMPFDDIIEELERHYSITIENNNKALGEDHFNASFEPTSIKNILEFFKEFYDIEYIIKDNKVVIE